MSDVEFARNDKLFLQEIINDLHRNGFGEYGKANQMLNDWSRELRERSHLRGKTRKVHAKLCGRENW